MTSQPQIPLPSENSGGVFNIFLGKSGSGKTYFMIQLINRYYANEFDRILIYAPEYHSNRNESNYRNLRAKIPAVIFAYFKMEEIEKVIKSIPYYKEGGKRTLIIFDDCVKHFAKYLRNDDNFLANIAMNGKHKGISCFVLSQSLKNVGTTLRTSSTAVFLFKTSYLPEIEKYADFTGLNKRNFKKMYTDMVWNKQGYPYMAIIDGEIC